jgi:hypothetical protein
MGIIGVASERTVGAPRPRCRHHECGCIRCADPATAEQWFTVSPASIEASAPIYTDTAVMSFVRSLLRNPAMRLYLLGYVFILLGAWLMEATRSMVPMALGASAAIMLALPLLRQMVERFVARRRMRRGPPR